MPRNKILYTEKQRQQAIALYSQNGSIAKTARAVGVSGEWSLRERLIEWGVEIGRWGGRTRRTKINDAAFSKNISESLYWGGFLLADGNVYYQSEGSSARIGLKLKDQEHVAKFANFLETDYRQQVLLEDGREKYVLQVLSTPIAEDLKRFGIGPNKTFFVRVPDKNKEIIHSRDFWRGYVDGDGSIGRKQKLPRFSLYSSSKAILWQFNEFLIVRDLKPLHVHQRRGNYFYVACTGNPAKLIIDVLYQNAQIYLDRKYLRAMEFIND